MLAFRPSRRQTALIVLVLSLGTLGFLWFGGETDEQAIARALRELADVVRSREGESFMFRTSRLNAAFKARLTPEISVEAPELARLSGIRAVLEAAAAAPRLYGDFTLELDDIEVEVEHGNERARATGRATLMALADARREQRRVIFQLEKRDEEWRVSGIEVAGRGD